MQCCTLFQTNNCRSISGGGMPFPYLLGLRPVTVTHSHLCSDPLFCLGITAWVTYLDKNQEGKQKLLRSTKQKQKCLGCCRNCERPANWAQPFCQRPYWLISIHNDMTLSSLSNLSKFDLWGDVQVMAVTEQCSPTNQNYCTLHSAYMGFRYMGVFLLRGQFWACPERNGLL